MHLSIRRPLSFLMSLVLMSFVISGCSSNLLVSQATSFSHDPMTLKVAQNSNAIGFFPVYVAQQENFFKAQGLTLDPSTPLQVGTGAKVTEAVESGQIELVAGGLITDAFTLARVDSSVKVLGALTTGYFVAVIESKRFEQQTGLTEASPLQDRVKALVGKRIGVTGLNSGTQALLTYLFRLYGYNLQKDATLVPLGGGTTTAGLQAMGSGRIDVMSLFSPAGAQAEAKGIGDTFISPAAGDVPGMVGQIHGVMYAKQSVIDAKPKAVQAFIRAIAQAEAFIHNNQDQAAVTVLLSKYLKLTPAASKNILKTTEPIIAQSPQVGQQGYNAASNFHVKAGLIAIALPYKDVVATNTINSALSGFSAT